MALRTIPLSMSLATLDDELVYSISRMKLHPLALMFVATFVALRVDLQDARATEITLRANIVESRAAIDVANEGLNDVIQRFWSAMKSIVGKNRTHPLYVQYFGDKTLGQFCRPALETKVKSVRKWVKTVGGEAPALQAFADEIKAKVAAADDALKAKEEAESARDTFRDAGARRMLFDKVNQTRREAYGQLGGMVYQHKQLPSRFATGFFLQAPSQSQDVEEEPTVEELQDYVAMLEADLVDAKNRIAVKQAEEAKAKEEAEKLQAEELEVEKLEAEARRRRARISSKK